MPCWPCHTLAAVLLSLFLWEKFKIERTERIKTTFILNVFFYLLSSLLSLFSLLTRIKAMTVLVSPNGVSSEIQFEISVSDKKRI